ncbi:hypothetical protein KR044_012063 [Drosophila immigrans]|nr:hypothetical protein KR044_012063 [Drosophila immigrans]
MEHLKFTECKNFLLQLRLSPYCANQLAMESMQRPDIDLLQLQQRWTRVKQLMGPQRRSEADAIVLREIQQQLLHERLKARTPTPPREWRCSTPNDDGNHEPCVYNIEADPRNNAEQAPSNHRNRFGHPQYREETAYNIHEDPRDVVAEFPRQQANHYVNWDHRINVNRNPYSQQQQQFHNHGYPNLQENNRGEFNGPARDAFGNCGNQQNWHYDNRNTHNANSDAYPREQQRDTSYQNDSGNETGNLSGQQMNHNDDREHRNHNYNHNPYSQDQRQQQRQRYDMNSRTQRVDYQQPKRRRLEEPQQPRRRKFRINEFAMPYIKFRKDELPQPEHLSHAISFYQCKRNSPAGGMAVRKNAGTPQNNDAIVPYNLSRQAYKKIRRNLRAVWESVYKTQEYSKWDLWWRGHKWCEVAIENELKRYADVDLNDLSFLNKNLNYGRSNDAISKVLEMTQVAFSVNNDFYAAMSTICELMNLQFLTNLKSSEMGQLQDHIRYMPNDLWTYKMKAIVYLWARYCSIQCFVDLTMPTEDKEVLATQVQWNRPLFHWMAREAFAELKRISAIEWPEHTL